MIRSRPAALLVLLANVGASMPAAADQDTMALVPRVEARSADLLAVGVVHGDRMIVHLSRLSDNAPVRDAALTVLLRGIVHPTTAEADGSYSLQTKDLDLPGSVSVVFQTAQGNVRHDLSGLLQIDAPQPQAESKNSARQLWWWVLNFAVCIGFLQLWVKRNKAAPQD